MPGPDDTRKRLDEKYKRKAAEYKHEWYLLHREQEMRSTELDREALLDRKDHKQHKVAAQRNAWYEANREKVAAQRKKGGTP